MYLATSRKRITITLEKIKQIYLQYFVNGDKIFEIIQDLDYFTGLVKITD